MPQRLIADLDEARRKTEAQQPARFERGSLGGLGSDSAEVSLLDGRYLMRKVTSIGTTVATGLPSGPLAGRNCHFFTVSMALCSRP